MKILDYIFAARPMLHLPVWSIFLVSLHYHHELNRGRFEFSDLAIVISLSLVTSAAYYLNQICDQESDRLNGKLGFLQRGLLHEKALMLIYLLVSCLALIIAAFVSTATFFVILILFVLGYVYSSSPWRLKDRPIGGLLTNALGLGFFIPLAVMPGMSFHSAGQLGWDNPFYFACAVGSIYGITTLPDKRGDEAVGKRTLAVLLPKRVVLLIALVLMLLSAWVSWYSDHSDLVYLSLFSSVWLVLTIILGSDKCVLLAAKLPILLLTILAGIFFWGYILFIVAILVAARIYYRKRFDITYPSLI